MQAGKSSSSSKRLARKARKAKLVVKQEKLDVGYDQALLATKYQVDQITIRFQPAGLGSDTPWQQPRFTRLPRSLCKSGEIVFMGPKSDHCIGYPCHSLNDWLTHSYFVDFVDVTVACNDANSILVEVVTVDAEKRVWQQFGSDVEAEVWSLS